VPPESRFVPRFAAEPSQEGLPYGRWQEQLDQVWLEAVGELEDAPADMGEPGEVLWYPDRGWHGRRYIPATCRTAGGYELWGYVRFVPPDDADGEPREFTARADFTHQTAESNPDWKIDLCDETVGSWRGESDARAAMTLVWGRPLLAGGRMVTAELAGVTVDQAPLTDERFTLLAPDDFRGDLLEIKLWDGRGRELARESLYEEEDREEG
jgi:hypothetical protein